MKRTITTILWILLFLLSVNFAFALGISPAKTVINSEETRTFSGQFLVINNDLEDMTVGMSAQGEAAPYITIDTQELTVHKDGGVGTVYFSIILPEHIPPGDILGAILIQQHSASLVENSISSQIVLYHKIVIAGPYPDKYVTTKLNFHESGNNIRFVSEVENKGKKDIENIKTTFYVNNKEQQQQVLDTETTSLKTKEDKLLDTTVDKKTFDRGEFQVLALTTYDGQKAEAVKKLLVGKPEVAVTYFDTFFLANKINPYSMDLLNKWNAPIENVYVDVEVKKDNQKIDQFRTKSVDLEAEMSKRITDYFDAKDKTPGKYAFDMIVNFWGVYRMETKTFQSELLTEKDSKKILQADSALTGEASTAELSSGNSENGFSLSAFIWIALGMFLALAATYIIWRYKHRREYEGGEERMI